ncbi:unnamed protein product [Spodoptera exigua]|uniref:Uncharacterized protein n=1 Tax=Spodoptera exigua TaxID=7107 RepID=A0A922SHH6_SPOEX|nr:hypothetical protein HF086_013392 [Spodoptera exigua]CAH0701678.1 unnamed protein product [Spodoptera exigua]
MQLKSAAGLVILAVTCVNCHPNVWKRDVLAPVHGLYVKTSADGTKGDLFVAATEENGVKSQWALDQPIGVLPVSTQPQAASVPVAYTPVYATTHEESTPQKRSTLTTPTSSTPVQYAYAVPVSSSTPVETTGTVASYPYAYTMTATATATETPKCEHQASAVQYPYQFPFHMFYPHMMSAYTNAMSILKEAGFSEDSASSVMAQASPMWSPTSYAYPMYVMIDPKPCTQDQTTTTTSTPATTTSNTSEETTQA